MKLFNTMLSKKHCGYCKKVEMVASRLNIDLEIIDLTDDKAKLIELSGRNTYPQVWIEGRHIGGCDDFLKYVESLS